DLLCCDPILAPDSCRCRHPTPVAAAAPAALLCAGHAQQLGGESPPANLMEVRPSDDARATAARRGLKEAWNKRASRWTKTGYKASAPDERATYREVHIHQGCEA